MTWRHLAIEGFDRLAGKGIFYGAARSEAPNTHGLDVHIIGAGNSAGQAAMFFSTPRAERDDPLPRRRRSRRACRSYLVDQLATRPNIDALLDAEVVGARTATTSLEAIDVRNSRDRRDDARTSRAGSSSSSARTRRPAWLPPEIALDANGYVLTGADVRAAGRLGARPRPVPARDERAGHLRRAATSASAR